MDGSLGEMKGNEDGTGAGMTRGVKRGSVMVRKGWGFGSCAEALLFAAVGGCFAEGVMTMMVFDSRHLGKVNSLSPRHLLVQKTCIE